MLNKKDMKNLGRGVAFLLPNILGFATFVLVPLFLSLYMAFSNWDLVQHNMFKDESIRLIGFSNFTQLFSSEDFWRFLGNTLFFMMGIPFGIAGSLLFAILLCQDFKSKKASGIKFILLGAILCTTVVVLSLMGMGASAFTIVLAGLFGLVVIGGMVGGSSVYRTLFYTPHFTAGVATFILWKKLYSPYSGPVNNVLTPLLDGVTTFVRSLPVGADTLLQCICLLLAVALFLVMIQRLIGQWGDAEAGISSIVLSVLVIALPLLCGAMWMDSTLLSLALIVSILCGLIWLVRSMTVKARLEESATWAGFGTNFMLSAFVMVLGFSLVGLSLVASSIQVMASTPDGLQPPNWLTDYHWAKPALIMMSLWAAVGSNNMILYLAGLTGIPQDFYEAAEMDGAGPFAKFWYITWPQLAPVTFFIVVMSVIHGLQGGFEMARAMTNGGPAGATTTLSYFVYEEGFQTGRLGFASAVAWTLFFLVFVITIFNTRFGNRYVND